MRFTAILYALLAAWLTPQTRPAQELPDVGAGTEIAAIEIHASVDPKA